MADLCKPKVAIWPRRDPARIARSGGDGELANYASRSDPSNLVNNVLGKPEVAIRARCDPTGESLRGGEGGLFDRVRQDSCWSRYGCPTRECRGVTAEMKNVGYDLQSSCDSTRHNDYNENDLDRHR